VDDLRRRFLGWQCRLRQIAMRQDGGRPSPGMRPRVLADAGEEIAPALTVLIIPDEPDESTAFFRFQLQRSADPRDAYERGLAFLQADYFQEPAAFSDRLVAVLPERSPAASRLVAEKRCLLVFDQWRQSFRLPCTVDELAVGDALRDAALWHNRLFNPMLPDSVHVLSFQPDWTSASADP
jgi:hypothetical protein